MDAAAIEERPPAVTAVARKSAHWIWHARRARRRHSPDAKIAQSSVYRSPARRHRRIKSGQCRLLCLSKLLDERRKQFRDRLVICLPPIQVRTPSTGVGWQCRDRIAVDADFFTAHRLGSHAYTPIR